MKAIIGVFLIIGVLIALAWIGFIWAANLEKDKDLWDKQVRESQCPSKTEPQNGNESRSDMP